MKCLICDGDYKHLGSHLKQHGVTAIDYKMEYGMDKNTPLMDPDLIKIKKDAFWNNPVGLKNLKENSYKYQFKRGMKLEKAYISDIVKNRLKNMCKNRFKPDIVGDIYENELSTTRRKIESVDTSNQNIIYTTSYYDYKINDWTPYQYEFFNRCSRAHLHKWGKKIGTPISINIYPDMNTI